MMLIANDKDEKNRRKGLALVLLSATLFSTAGIFTNAVSASAWDVIFWRGLAAAGFTLSYLLLRKQFKREVKAFGFPALVISLMLALGTATFIPAFKISGVANVALIYAAAPFIAAGLSWIFLREAPKLRVILASLMALAGVGLIVSGSVETLKWQGDVLALLMTFAMAGSMVMYRKYPRTTAALPAALSSLFLLPISFVLGRPFDVPAHELWALVVFGLVFAVAAVALSEGARRLPSAETALASILEMPLAPVLALVILLEVPSKATLIGGLVIFVSVLWSLLPNKKEPYTKKEGAG